MTAAFRFLNGGLWGAQRGRSNGAVELVLVPRRSGWQLRSWLSMLERRLEQYFVFPLTAFSDPTVCCALMAMMIYEIGNNYRRSLFKQECDEDLGPSLRSTF